MATARFREMLETQRSEGQPVLENVHVQETQVIIPGSPPPNGTVLVRPPTSYAPVFLSLDADVYFQQTASGPRHLPIDSFATIRIDRAQGHAVGEARFFTAGTGDYAGAARVDYAILRRDEADQEMKSVWGPGEPGKRKAADGESAKRRRGEVFDKVLWPLWQLEREVWAERAEEVLKSGLDGVE